MTKVGTFFIVASCLVGLVPGLGLTAPHSASNLPTDEEVSGILKLCAVGRVQKYEGEVRGKIDFWKKGASGTGTGTIEDLGALLSAIKPDPNSVKIYQTYVTCIKESVGAYLQQPSRSRDSIDSSGFQLNRYGNRICKPTEPTTEIIRDAQGNTIGISKRFPLSGETSCLMAPGTWVPQ